MLVFNKIKYLFSLNCTSHIYLIKGNERHGVQQVKVACPSPLFCPGVPSSGLLKFKSDSQY